MKISEIFDLKKTQRELDFVDVDFPNDIPLFLNPFIIKNSTSDIGVESEECISSFFDLIINYLRNDNKKAALELMSKLGEINEVHLGFSSGKSRGNGLGAYDTQKLVKSIVSSEAVKSGVVEKLEDFSLFIEGISRDKISDLIGNVIKKILIKYTQRQCDLWGIQMTEKCKTGFYWDYIDRQWKQSEERMLVINNQVVLLVPKEFVSYSKSAPQSIYYQHFVLEYYQEEYIRVDHYLVKERKNKKGEVKEKYVLKKDIIDDFSKRNIAINKAWLAQFSLNHPEVLDKYRREAILSELDPNQMVTPSELNEVADGIIKELNNIHTGIENATRYQKLVCGACELLFYPALTNPKMETEIQDGLKRIDITFSNRATNGFFRKIVEINDIPAHSIIIECKNYSNDVSNPEFDQLAGRFSNNRGKIGFLFCRNIADREKMLARERNLWKERSEIIIHIDDARLIKMLNNFKDVFNDSYNDYLFELFDEIIRY